MENKNTDSMKTFDNDTKEKGLNGWEPETGKEVEILPTNYHYPTPIMTKAQPQGSLETIPFFIKHSLQVINITKFFFF